MEKGKRGITGKSGKVEIGKRKKGQRAEEKKNIIIRRINFEERKLKCEIERFLAMKLKVETKIRNA